MNAADLDPALDYIFTIGHSNQTFEALLGNLRAYEIEAVDDDTRPPSSRGSHAGSGEDTAAPASRAQTGRALGNYAEADGITPDHTIWNLWELTELPIFG